MEKKKTGSCLDKKSNRNISLMKWENIDRDGRAFTSYSLVRTVRRRNPDDMSETISKPFSLNCLTRNNLADIRLVIEQMTHAEADGDGLLEAE